MFEEDKFKNEGPHVDFTFQFTSAREYQKIEKKILHQLCAVAEESHKSSNKIGLLIVWGNFNYSTDNHVYGMRQISINPIQKYLNISSESSKEEISELLREGLDGAIIINNDGQVLGSKIYLIVENPILEIPEGTGTRHISAASFSKREDVMAVFTLSEETSVVRVWKDGVPEEKFNPGEDNQDIK